MQGANTNSVQNFIGFIVWIISFLVLGLLFLILGGISSTILGEFWILGIPTLILNFWLSSIFAGMFFILPEWNSLVLLRLGRFSEVKKAGFFIIPPFIYSVASILDIRIEVHQVEATNTLTADNVPIKVTAAVEFRVEDPKKATIDVFNYRTSVVWLATEALKNTIGGLTLQDLLSEREEIAKSLTAQIDANAVKYGVDVHAVRITDIDTPKSLVEELAVIARARRAAKAKRIQAEAEVIVADKLAEASKTLREADAMRLRELQILNEMSKEESSMIIIYPYGDREGERIAGATAGSASNKKKKIQLPPPTV